MKSPPSSSSPELMMLPLKRRVLCKLRWCQRLLTTLVPHAPWQRVVLRACHLHT
jgi:hypothetical protein